MIYWVFWVILALLMALLVAYIININTTTTLTYECHRREKSVYNGLAFAGIVSALGVSAFAITLFPEFYIYSKYFEHQVIGVIRFIVMIIIALLLIHYAVTGRRWQEQE